MNPNDIRLLFYLPNLSSYLDRAALIETVAGRIGKTVLLTSKMDIDPDEAKLSKTRLVFPEGNTKRGNAMFQASRMAKKLLKDEPFDVVHDTFGHLLPLFLGKSRFPNTRFVTSLHNFAAWDFHEFHWRHYSWHRFFSNPDLRQCVLRVPLQYLICRTADRIVLQAEDLKSRLNVYQQVPDEKVHWIPNNIDLSVWPQPSGAGQTYEQRDHIKLLFIGGVSMAKGCDSLLELLSLARTRGCRIELTAVGGTASADREHFDRKIRDLELKPFIHFMPRTDRTRLVRLFHEHDWLYHASLLEGSPRVVLEALAMGLPVIASRHPGIRVLDPEERFILFTEAGEEEHLLEQLIREQTGPDHRVLRSRKGQEEVGHRFSSEAVASQYVDFYTRLCRLED